METFLRLSYGPTLDFQAWRDQVRGAADLLRIGEGAAEGTFRGYLDDAQRALSVIPETRSLRPVLDAASMAITGAGVVESMVAGKGIGREGKARLAAMILGAALGAKGKGKSAGQAVPPSIDAEGHQPRTIAKKEFVANHVADRQLTPKQIAARKQRVKRCTPTSLATSEKGRRPPRSPSWRHRTASCSISSVQARSRSPVGSSRGCAGTRSLTPGHNRDQTRSKETDHFHHAEPAGVMAAVSSDFKIVAVFPSWDACPLCLQMIENLGIPIFDPD